VREEILGGTLRGFSKTHIAKHRIGGDGLYLSRGKMRACMAGWRSLACWGKKRKKRAVKARELRARGGRDKVGGRESLQMYGVTNTFKTVVILRILKRES